MMTAYEANNIKKSESLDTISIIARELRATNHGRYTHRELIEQARAIVARLA